MNFLFFGGFSYNQEGFHRHWENILIWEKKSFLISCYKTYQKLDSTNKTQQIISNILKFSKYVDVTLKDMLQEFY